MCNDSFRIGCAQSSLGRDPGGVPSTFSLEILIQQYLYINVVELKCNIMLVTYFDNSYNS